MTSTIDTELEAFIEQCIDALSHQVQGTRRESGEWRLILRHANLVTADDEQRERDLLSSRPG